VSTPIRPSVAVIERPVFPVGAAEVARIRLTSGPALSNRFLEAFQFVEARHQLKCAGGFCGEEPHHAEAAPDAGFEAEDRFDHIESCTLHAARRRASFGDGEPACHGSRLLCHQQRRDIISALARCDRPGEGEEVAPVAIGRKERRDRHPASALQRDVEPAEPRLGKLHLGADRGLLQNPWVCGVHIVVLVVCSL
jgi:hypothetical protein